VQEVPGFKSRQPDQIPQRVTAREIFKPLFWSPTGVHFRTQPAPVGLRIASLSKYGNFGREFSGGSLLPNKTRQTGPNRLIPLFESLSSSRNFPTRNPTNRCWKPDIREAKSRRLRPDEAGLRPVQSTGSGRGSKLLNGVIGYDSAAIDLFLALDATVGPRHGCHTLR
jgi:hypothetical protein